MDAPLAICAGTRYKVLSRQYENALVLRAGDRVGSIG